MPRFSFFSAASSTEIDLPSSSETRFRWEAARDSWRYEDETRSENEPSSFSEADMQPPWPYEPRRSPLRGPLLVAIQATGHPGFRRADGNPPANPKSDYHTPWSCISGARPESMPV